MLFGFALFWKGNRGAGTALAFAVTLGVVASAGNAISVGLSFGDPIMPQTRFEWVENFETTIGIALSFMVGHALARALRAARARRFGRT